LKVEFELDEEEDRLVRAAMVLRGETDLNKFAKKVLLEGGAAVFDVAGNIEARDRLEKIAEAI